METQDGETYDFPITIGLYQGQTLSLYLFTLILVVLTKHIRELTLRCMPFVDDIVVLEESNEDLNESLEINFRNTWFSPKQK